MHACHRGDYSLFEAFILPFIRPVFSQLHVNQNISHIARVRKLMDSIRKPRCIVTLVLWKEQTKNKGQNKKTGLNPICVAGPRMGGKESK